MEVLIKEISKKLSQVDQSKREIISKFDNVYPFNDIELKLSLLLHEDIITLNEFLEMREQYFNRNKFLYTYEKSGPRDFGENWAQKFVHDLIPELLKPNRKLDPNFDGEYDFWLDGIKIEVKASRAVEKKPGKTLVEKALKFDSNKKFDMNFQQLKPYCCDVFLWIGVWRDIVKFWVLSSDEVVTNQYFSTGQHRGNTNEGQLWIKDSNIRDFDRYLKEPEEILEYIKNLSISNKM